MVGAFPKLLFDENLGPGLVRLIASSYPASAHLRDLGLEGAKDTVVWAYAAEHGFVLVTKDEDFHRLSVFRGFPPKVIWVRLGNCTTAEVAALLELHRSAIVEFVAHPEVAFLAVG
jgi:predicted nuclease of predicted toxin-antitoxin system